MSYVPHVLIVSNKLGLKSLPDLIALAKTRPVTLATSGFGSATHMTVERFKQATGADITHVPYKSGGSLLPDVITGNIDGAMTELSTAMELHKGGQALILGVAGASRSKLAPDIPTFDEQGMKGFVARSFIGIVAPAKTPRRHHRQVAGGDRGGARGRQPGCRESHRHGLRDRLGRADDARRLRGLHQGRLRGHAGGGPARRHRQEVMRSCAHKRAAMTAAA